MRFEDYYQILGLKPDADAPAIRQAYRRLARLHHPDLSTASDAHAVMARINEAYETLSDRQRRTAYDGVRRRHLTLKTSSSSASAEMPGNWKQGFEFQGAPTGGRSGEGFSDFFTSMFGRAAKPDAPDTSPERGADEHLKLTIDASDAVSGALRSVNVRSLAPDEKGHRAVVQRKVQLQIPKGIKSGQHIRVSGQGSAGRGGAAAGDLYVEIRFKQDPAGTSRDLHKPLPLAPWEAALGAEVAASTPMGPVSVSVPPDTPHGKRLRLKGRGLAGAPNGDPDGEPSGDMVLEVEVVLPPSTLPGARTAYDAMQHILGREFKPREGASGAASS